MAKLTIPFPEGTRAISLKGIRITIGRMPDNTIQIRDRTISAYHAELIEEGDHYRLHDNRSTNGVIIDGQRVTDFHLREDCKVNLGGLVCDFHAAAQEEASKEQEAIPTRSEMLTILQANGELLNEVASLRSQVETMTKARESAGNGAGTVSLEQHDQLAAELAGVRATLQERQTQLDRLTSLLAIASRDREILQKGYDDARATLDKVREVAPAEATKPAASTAPATEPLEASAPQPSAPAVPATPSASAPAPSAPARPPTAPGAPKMPQPAGASGITPPVAPKAPAAPTPAMPAGAKALPKPPPSIGSGSPSRRPASGIQPAVAKPPGAAAALVTAGTGPKGTQKLVE